MGKRVGDEIRPLPKPEIARPEQCPPVQKYIIREKTIHHRHFLKYDTSRNQFLEYCKESGCAYKKVELREARNANRLRTTEVKTEYYKNLERETKNRSRAVGKENCNPIKHYKYDTKYPDNFTDTKKSPKTNQSLKYIMKPILYSRIDEYFVENEKEDAIKRARRYKQNKTKAEIIKNFQELYENHCRLIEAQNIFIHEHMQLVKAREMLQASSEKTRWMENHAQVFSTRHHKVDSNRAQVFKQHKKMENSVFQQLKAPAPIYQQYVSSL